MSFYFLPFTKSEKRRVEQVLPEEVGTRKRRRGMEW
jgi:hypothetical protein